MVATFQLELVTPQRKIFDGPAVSLQVPAYEGFMGILAHHAPLLAELVPGEVTVTDAQGQTSVYSLAGGFIEVGGNRAIILADAAERADEIDVERAEAARRRAEERLKKHRAEIELDRAELALRRALVRLRVAERYGRKGRRTAGAAGESSSSR